jgi:hypothetical protein
MTVHLRTSDELAEAPELATLPALSACIDAFVAVLDVSHPSLLASVDPRSARESAALLLHMHLSVCQQLLREYDHLTFDAIRWNFTDPDEHHQPEPRDDPEPDDDIPF